MTSRAARRAGSSLSTVTGRVKDGWPVALPFAALYGGVSGESDLDCPSELLYVVPPIVAGDGSVFAFGRRQAGGDVHGTTSIAAFRPNGSAAINPPYTTSAQLSSGCFGVHDQACWASVQPVVASDGHVYAAIGPTGKRSEGFIDKLLALEVNGRARGWPVTLTTRNGATTGLAARPGRRRDRGPHRRGGDLRGRPRRGREDRLPNDPHRDGSGPSARLDRHCRNSRADHLERPRCQVAGGRAARPRR